MVMVRVDAVTKRFGEVPALTELSVDVGDGEFFIMVGPSGCGKTTLLRILAGLERPDSGEVWFGDRRVTATDPGSREVGMVFQNYALYPHLSIYENLAFGLRVRRVNRHEVRSRVTEVATLLDLQDLLERKPKQLSGGQRQRVALGRAIVRQPSVFLMDEPLSNLDAHLRAEMRGEILKLHRRLGATFIFVTHDQVEALTMGDRIAVMAGGKILQVGTPDDLYLRPMNQFVAGFIGSPPMNILRGELAATGTAGGMQVGEQVREGKCPAVGAAGQQGADNISGRLIDVGDQLDTVAHRDLDLADGVAGGRRWQSQCLGEGAVDESSGQGGQRRPGGPVGGRHRIRLGPSRR